MNKPKLKTISFLFFTFLILMVGKAQDKTVVSQSYISSGLKQIKENANFGLVFNGPNLNYGHYWASSKNNRIFIVENEI